MENGFSFICKNFSFCNKITAFLFIIFLLPKVPLSHSHDIEDPSFKYSRKANKGFNNVGHSGNHISQHSHSFNGHADNTSMSEVWLHSMASTFFISAVPFILLFVIPLDNSNEKRPRLKVLLAFASGGLLGDAFLHLIPHATNLHHSHDIHHSHSHESSLVSESPNSNVHDHSKEIVIGLWVLCGIIAFLTVEKFVRFLKGDNDLGHGHGHVPSTKKAKVDNKRLKKNEKQLEKTTEKKKERLEISGYLNLAADFAHNFTDGLAIGASYLAGNSIGLVTTITILLHEVPHEIGDFAILIKAGCSRRKAMVLQLVTAVGALSGNALALVGVGTEDKTAPWVLPFTAGGFIYIATVSVLPELLEESTKLGQSIKEIAALLTGVALMVFIANFE